MFYFKNCICNYLFLLHFILTYLSFPVTSSLVHFNETDERKNNSSCVQLRLADSSLSFMYSDLLFPSIKPAIYFSLGPFIHWKSFTSVSAGACNFPSLFLLLNRDLCWWNVILQLHSLYLMNVFMSSATFTQEENHLWWSLKYARVCAHGTTMCTHFSELFTRMVWVNNKHWGSRTIHYWLHPGF